jgi:hypothetical protein
MHSSIEYSVRGRPLRLFQNFNIGLHVSLIYALIHWVLGQASATPTVPVFPYWIACKPDLDTHPMSIESIIGHYDDSSVSILDVMSAWSRPSSVEYWVKGPPLRPFRCFNIRFHIWVRCPQYQMDDCIDQAEMQSNIETLELSEWPTLNPIPDGWMYRSGWHVSPILTLIHRVLTQHSATTTIPVFQYWMSCQPDLTPHPLSIGSRVGHSDYSGVSIFDSISAWSIPSSIEYWVKCRPLWLLQCFNIGFHVSLI